jgi:hypothetical protein
MFSSNREESSFRKIRLVGAKLFHIDRQMDGETDRHDEANSPYFQFFKRA